MLHPNMLRFPRAARTPSAFLLALILCTAGAGASASPAAASTTHPSWKIQVIIYKNTDITYTDSVGGSHHFVGAALPSDVSLAAADATKFVNTDIPALSSGNQRAVLTIKTINAAVTRLDSDGNGGFTPSPTTTTADLSAGFDSHIVLWESAGWDFSTAQSDELAHYGGLTWPMGTAPTFTTIPIPYLRSDDRNVFKHEWGHAITGYYDAAGTAPKPMVDPHAPSTSVNCHTGRGYVQVDDSDTKPVPNSIFNDASGFTHDYYSGVTATSDHPTRCLGITPAAWARGGPITKPAAPRRP